MTNKALIKKISSQSNLIVIIILILFFIICLNYSSQINLWGDEAFSLNSAESSFKTILVVDSTHTPIYYLLLKLITDLGLKNEFLLRLLHTIPFIIGLFIGYRTLINVFPNKEKALIILAIAILLPNYIFYATNIRMYSLLFMFSMAFIASLANLYQNNHHLNNWQLIKLGLISFALLLCDYSGIVYYLPGLFFLVIQSFFVRSYRALLIVGGAGLFFLVVMFIFTDIVESIRYILSWPVAASQNVGNINQNLVELAKQIYLSLRPGLDLFYGAGINSGLAIGLAAILLILYLYSFWIILKHSKNKPAIKWILFTSMIWLFAAPTGYSFTRIFLPCHFYMIAIIIYSLGFVNKVSQFVYWMILGALIAICLKEAIKPTLRLYNLIPYQQIANETLEIAQEQKAKTILLSSNSLNTLSIERYLKQDSPKEGIEVIRIDSNNIQQVKSKTEPLIFISHLKEGEEFMDVKLLAKNLNKTAQEIKGYVNLENLPYNSVWKKRITDRANQPYAIQTYLLK